MRTFSNFFFKPAGLLVLGLTGQACMAQQPLVVIAGSGGVNPPLERCLELSVIGDYRGRLAPLFDEQAQSWVASGDQEPYSIRIENKCSYRLLASIAVDGLNVVDGKTPGVGGAGYVVNGYESRTISGWRTSLTDVARFYFTDPLQSYVFRTTGREPSGLIELGVYVEEYPVQPNYLSTVPLPLGQPSFGSLPPIVSSQPVPVERPGSPARRTRPELVGPPGNQRFAQPLQNRQSAPSNPPPNFTAQSSSSSSIGTGFGQAKSETVSISDFKPTTVLPVLRQFLRYAPLSELNRMNLSGLRPNLPSGEQISAPYGFAVEPR